MHKTMVGIAAASVAIFGFMTSAQAALFIKDPQLPSPTGTKLFLDSAKNSATSNGTVDSPDDVGIAVTGNADFASGWSTIKPVKDGTLTDLIFTPDSPTAFNKFSFRGQDIEADQVITVIITDQANNPTTITFTEGNANQDFARDGIIAAIAGETIKSVEIQNPGGFKEAKQFLFGLDDTVGTTGGGGGIPEPAAWITMIAGFGLLGALLRRRSHATGLVAS